MNGLAPSYLSNMLNLYSHARALRSADSNILKQPKARTKYGECHFAFAAATLWNGLTMHIRSTGKCPSCKISANSIVIYIILL
jgi:hypothetical protein